MRMTGHLNFCICTPAGRRLLKCRQNPLARHGSEAQALPAQNIGDRAWRAAECLGQFLSIKAAAPEFADGEP